MKRLSILRAVAVVGLLAGGVLGQATSSIEKEFKEPGNAVGPYVWWHWMGSNYSKDGITKDLQTMKDSGIGGATIFNLTSAVQESHAPTKNNPWPERTYRSPAYWEHLKWAAIEADRIGVEIGLHNTVGYSTTGGPWITEPQSIQRMIWSITPVGGGKLIDISLKQATIPLYKSWGGITRQPTLYKDLYVLAVPEKDNVDVMDVINISSSMDASGNLKWNAPDGKWKIYRFGHASTGAMPHPVPDELIGKTLEANKMDAEISQFHWSTVLDPVKSTLGPLVGKSFKHMLIDSYEAGGQSWTTGFAEEFKKRKGYDCVPWLVTLNLASKEDRAKSGSIIKNANAADRFAWDYADVIKQLYLENGWMVGVKNLHNSNLKLQFEPYGGPFDTAEGAAISDLPMGEFWTTSKGDINQTVVQAAHAAGRTVIGAEAFTGRPEVSKWQEHPAMLKLSCDGAFGAGVNRMILHHWVHQPFGDEYKPGMGMGWWGTHFGRNQTWFEPGKAFFQYIARSQSLLQRGESVADYLSIGNPTGTGDLVPVSAVLRGDLKVVDKQIVLPSGRKYPILVMPDSDKALPELLEKIEPIAAQGVLIVGNAPKASPSLTNYPACDEQVQTLAKKIWNHKNVMQRNQLDKAVEAALGGPDFNVVTPGIKDIRILHRRDGAADIYYIGNLNSKKTDFSVSLRVSGKQPEIWQAEDGSITPAASWSEDAGRTIVDLRLNPLQSVFIVLRSPAAGKEHLASVDTTTLKDDTKIFINDAGETIVQSSEAVDVSGKTASGKDVKVSIKPLPAQSVDGPWEVSFDESMGAPKTTTFAQLISWSKHDNPGIKYYSGTATYHKTISIPKEWIHTKQRVILDLGEVANLATIHVNDKNLGVSWRPAYRADVTDAVKAGDNDLRIVVTNTWANRLIGDEQEPTDFDWGTDRGPKMGKAMAGYPDWFVKGQPRPSKGRKGFIVWSYFTKESELLPAGLIGPVKLIPQAQAVLVKP